MKQIGKNHSCPCLSGRKYKDCCLQRSFLADYRQEGYTYYNENYALKNVQDINIFKNFYEQNRPKITKELLWFEKEDLGSAMSYGEDNFEGQAMYLIVGKTMPLPANNVIQVTHELQHLLLIEEGYKYVRFKEGRGTRKNRLSKILNDMLLDPIVNREIMKYGFDLSEYHLRVDETLKKAIGRHEINNLSFEQIALIFTLYVKKTLEMRNINPEIHDEEVEFNKWITSNYPGLVLTAKTILRIIDQTGYDSPQKVESVFLQIIDLLQLNDLLECR